MGHFSAWGMWSGIVLGVGEFFIIYRRFATKENLIYPVDEVFKERVNAIENRE